MSEQGAEFPLELLNSIYASITKMLPQAFEHLREDQKQPVFTAFVEDDPMEMADGEGSEEGGRKALEDKFPSLAIPDQNKDEIDLDEDLLGFGDML